MADAVEGEFEDPNAKSVRSARGRVLHRTDDTMESADGDWMELKCAGTDSRQSLGKRRRWTLRSEFGSNSGADMNKKIIHCLR